MMATFSNAMLFCLGLALIMERSAIARQPAWEDWARQFGQLPPGAPVRKSIVVIAGLALLGTGLLRFLVPG
jgi:hypothetical protein